MVGKSRRGAILFEALALITIFLGTFFFLHLEVISYWNRRLDAMQSSRLKYDGELIWKPYKSFLGNYKSDD